MKEIYFQSELEKQDMFDYNNTTEKIIYTREIWTTLRHYKF